MAKIIGTFDNAIHAVRSAHGNASNSDHFRYAPFYLRRNRGINNV